METGARSVPSAALPPRLLRSLTSAVLTDGAGDVSLPREARGTVDDWGGVYAQLVRLTGAWRVTVYDGERELRLPEGQVAASRRGDRWTSEHRFGRLTVRQEIAALERPPGASRRLAFSVADGPPVRLSLLSAFGPYLLPTMVEGIRPLSYRLETAAEGLTVRQRGFALGFRSSVPPSHLYVNRASWIGGRWTGPAWEVGTDHDLEVVPGAEVVWHGVIAGGLERDLQHAGPDLEAAVGDPGPVLASSEAADAAWVAGTPTLRFPQAPDLERAYEAGRWALRQLYCAPGDSLTGVVAGYPWYASIWCRDLAWMLPALLWLGDFEWTERSLASVFRFQARSRIPLLGGEPGELPMQVSPGPVFLYGTSDTTLYFPELALRWVRHTGDPRPLPEWLPSLHRVLGWGTARTDPATGLLRNGGEAEEISAATGALAKVRYGIDSPDTTIWDSADRRDHAVDVQVLWLAALRAVLEIDPGEAAPGDRDRWRALADRLAGTIPTAYDWPAEGYLYDSLRAGDPVAKLRPNALRAVSAGLLSPERARAAVRRAGMDDLCTPWGMRTLSARDPGYRADAYHDGQVWTIATAWAADAAFAAGDPDVGRAHLGRIAERFRAEGGGANECYRGDRPEPFDSCFLLGLSVGPFLSVLFERLWGLRPDARSGRLEVAPNFPSGWTSAALEGLRFGPGRVALEFDAPNLTAHWTGPGALELVVAGAPRRVEAGGTVTVRCANGPPAA